MINNKTITEMYERVCKDSGYKLDMQKAATLTASVLKISPLEVWIGVGSVDKMIQIASGDQKGNDCV